jgi:hypothetical protein
VYLKHWQVPTKNSKMQEMALAVWDQLLSILIMNSYYPELPSVLVSMLFHFEPDSDFTIRCMYTPRYVFSVMDNKLVYVIVNMWGPV